jgi:serine/threonine-protein kinase
MKLEACSALQLVLCSSQRIGGTGDAPVDDLIERQIGQYKITARLGKGGMATVYWAYQPSMGRDVAIKVIKTDLSNDTRIIERFNQEAQIIANLQHPHILRVFDFGTEGDLLYLVMELKKRNLAERLKEKGQLPAEEVARYLGQICAALDYAHSENVIHRDLKPQNVLLDEQNNAFLSDFGIARLASELTRTTTIITMVGTSAHMAPEQWYGRGVDARADVYALAMMIYELLAGDLPFTGDTPPALMYQHLNEPPPPIRRVRPDLPEKVEAVLQKGDGEAR